MSEFNAPDIDYAGLAPIIALTVGMCVVLMVGLLRVNRFVIAYLTLAVLAAAAGLSIWQWGEQEDLVAGALRLDELALALYPQVILERADESATAAVEAAKTEVARR